MDAGIAGFGGIVLLVVGLTHLDDLTPSHVRIGWAALGFAALLFVLATVLAIHETRNGEPD